MADKVPPQSIEVFQHRLDGHETVLKELVSGMREVRDALLAIPKQSTLSERMKTVAATVSIIIAYLAVSEGWLNARLVADRQTVSRIERQADDLPVLKYRVEQIEKSISGPSR